MTSMPAVDYFAAEGLSFSGMKDLAVSPLRFWHKHLNPLRVKEEPSAEMEIGSAVHCAVLEPDHFEARYACELIAPPDCLRTIQDIREWITSKGKTPKGTRKDDIIAQAFAIPDEHPVIFDALEFEHNEKHQGKVIFKQGDWNRVLDCAIALKEEPHVQRMLSTGQAEVSMFATDPDTQVPMKARMDWVTPTSIVDFKTFCAYNGKSIDKAIADTIFYQGYLKQAYHYTTIRRLVERKDSDFIFVFVESEPPHEIRIKSLRPKTGGQANVYWTTPMIEVRHLLRLYAECVKEFGDAPWRRHQEVEPLVDEDIKQLLY